MSLIRLAETGCCKNASRTITSVLFELAKTLRLHASLPFLDLFVCFVDSVWPSLLYYSTVKKPQKQFKCLWFIMIGDNRTSYGLNDQCDLEWSAVKIKEKWTPWICLIVELSQLVVFERWLQLLTRPYNGFRRQLKDIVFVTKFRKQEHWSISCTGWQQSPVLLVKSWRFAQGITKLSDK